MKKEGEIKKREISRWIQGDTTIEEETRKN